jgi:RNA polymerase sigma factor (sigma-70 family)
MATMNENDMIEQNMGLAVNIVKYFKPRNKLEFDEYLQQARLGLWRAAKKYISEPKIGAFSTIAQPSIIWEILDLIKQRKRHPHKSLIDSPYSLGDPLWELLPNSLTEDEKRVIILMTEGYKKNEIYRNLGISQTRFNHLFKSAARKIKRANSEKNSVL